MTLAVDDPFFARTRLPDLKFYGGAKDVDGGTIVLQPGAVLHVDVLHETGAAVPDHEVYIEDTLPRSPLTYRPVRTDRRGRATFERLGPGRYRVSTSAVRRCANRIFLTAARVVPIPGSGTVLTQLIAGGRASFRVTSPFGPMRGTDVSVSPDTAPVPTPFGGRATPAGCPGATDAEGRVAFANVPPGPASVSVHVGNSTYVRQVELSSDGEAIEIVVPDGFLPVRVLNGARNEPVPGASVTWTAGGARVEATSSVTGEALLANVGTAAGTLVVSARGYETAEEPLAEPPGILHDIALAPAAPAGRIVRAHVISASGDAIPNAVIEVIAADQSAIPRVAVTDEKGAVMFSDVPRGSVRVIAGADGFATSTIQIGDDQAAELVLRRSR